MTKKQVCVIMLSEMLAEDSEGLFLPSHLKNQKPNLMCEVIRLYEELEQNPKEGKKEFTGGSEAFRASLEHHLKERHLSL